MAPQPPFQRPNQGQYHPPEADPWLTSASSSSDAPSVATSGQPLQSPSPASVRPTAPQPHSEETKTREDIPSYDEAIANTIPSQHRTSNNAHLSSPPPSQPIVSCGPPAHPSPGLNFPHRVILIQHQPMSVPSSHFTTPPMPPPQAQPPTILLYTSDPGVARRRALARFVKAFLWAWIISIFIAYFSGALRVVEYDSDEDWNDGWSRMTGISMHWRQS